jgi:hypothetical protein
MKTSNMKVAETVYSAYLNTYFKTTIMCLLFSSLTALAITSFDKRGDNFHSVAKNRASGIMASIGYR